MVDDVTNPLASTPGTQTLWGALCAVRDHLNITRETALTAARAAYQAKHGQSVDYPPEGPVLPSCVIDDPTDDEFDPKPNADPKIIRRLSLISATARQGELLDAQVDEPQHNDELEWVIICPAQYTLEQCQDIFRRGIAEIEAVLAPLRYSGLTPRPDVTDQRQAISFNFPNAERLAFDVGEHRAFAIAISLDFTLNAVSCLS